MTLLRRFKMTYVTTVTAMTRLAYRKGRRAQRVVMMTQQLRLSGETSHPFEDQV